jgi:hypothetical protein
LTRLAARRATLSKPTSQTSLPASQRARWQIEEAFAWIRIIALRAKTSFRGTAWAGWGPLTLPAAACNLIRLPKLLGALS